MNKDEQAGRLSVLSDTMAQQLRDIREDIVTIQLILEPYHRIITELLADYEEAKNGDE